MIFESEKRRLVGAEAPVIRAAITVLPTVIQIAFSARITSADLLGVMYLSPALLVLNR